MVTIGAMLLAWIGLSVLAIRQLKSLGGRSENLPLGWLITAGIALIVAPIVTGGLQIAQMRIVGPSWFGESSLYLGVGSFAIHLCVVVFCFVAMCKFSEPSGQRI